MRAAKYHLDNRTKKKKKKVSRAVWNTNDDRYSDIVHFNSPHFVSITVWNTNDNRYSKFCHFYEKICLKTPLCSQGFVSRTVWNTNDGRLTTVTTHNRAKCNKIVTYCVDELFSSNEKCNKILLFYIMVNYYSEMEVKSYQTKLCKYINFKT